MRMPRFRFTLRRMMVFVAIVAIVAGAYMFGQRRGARSVLNAPRDSAMTISQTVTARSDEERCAIYYAMLSQERDSPGSAKRVTKIHAKKLAGPDEWAVMYRDLGVGRDFELHLQVPGEWVQSYKKLAAE
jgi:D-serine deaminase-like pyridoxal phosphate-dependent protein